MNGHERIQAYLDRAFLTGPQTEGLLEAKETLLADLGEKYDSLTAQGYSEQGAYETVISGIGDIFEIVDEAAGEGLALPSGPEIRGGKRALCFPLLAAAFLLLWAAGLGGLSFPLLPALALGAAAGFFLSRWPLFIQRAKSARRQGDQGFWLTPMLWAAAALLFILAFFIPALGRIQWLIPAAAISTDRLASSLRAYSRFKKGGSL